jgi:hypothetical protein
MAAIVLLSVGFFEAACVTCCAGAAKEKTKEQTITKAWMRSFIVAGV